MAAIPLPVCEVFDVEYSQPFFRQDTCRLRSVPWLMCAVYRRVVLKLWFVTARSRAISMSCLCRNSSYIRIRIADEIPLILSVATFYIYICIYHMRCCERLYGITVSVVLRDAFCFMSSNGVTTSLPLSVRNLLLRLGVLVGIINWYLSLVTVLSFLPLVSTLWTLVVGFTFLHILRAISLFVGHLWGVGCPVRGLVLFATSLPTGVSDCPVARSRYTGCPSHYVHVPLRLWPSPVCQMFHASSGAAYVTF